jgi:hypothetical protein
MPCHDGTHGPVFLQALRALRFSPSTHVSGLVTDIVNLLL